MYVRFSVCVCVFVSARFLLLTDTLVSFGLLVLVCIVRVSG